MRKVTIKAYFPALFFLLIFSLSSRTFADQSFQQYYDQGQQAYQRGSLDKAIEFFNAALEIDPNSAEVNNALGLVYRDKNAPLSEVAWYFKVAVDINPSYGEPYEHLGKLYSAAGKFDQAIHYFNKALEIYPEHLGIQFALAWVYLNGKSQPQDAIFYFEKVVEKRDIPSAYYGLGLAYAMNDESARSLETITALRHQGYEELAVQLEDMIRTEYSPKTSVVPQGPETEVLRPVPSTIRPRGVPSGNTRVRLRGTLYNAGQQSDGVTTNTNPRQKTQYKKPDVLRSE